jgi:hypothetical protein
MSTQPEGFGYALQYLMGEVHALGLFCSAVAHTRPDCRVLLAHMDLAEQQALAHIEALPLRDAAVDGYRFLFDNAQKAMSDRSRSQRSGARFQHPCHSNSHGPGSRSAPDEIRPQRHGAAWVVHWAAYLKTDGSRYGQSALQTDGDAQILSGLGGMDL